MLENKEEDEKESSRYSSRGSTTRNGTFLLTETYEQAQASFRIWCQTFPKPSSITIAKHIVASMLQHGSFSDILIK